jgi:hypothetical protein
MAVWNAGTSERMKNAASAITTGRGRNPQKWTPQLTADGKMPERHVKMKSAIPVQPITASNGRWCG